MDGRGKITADSICCMEPKTCLGPPVNVSLVLDKKRIAYDFRVAKTCQSTGIQTDQPCPDRLLEKVSVLLLKLSLW